MNLSEDCYLTYTIAHEAWYAQIGNVVDHPEIWVHSSARRGGVDWEFSVEEVALGKPVPAIRAKVFDDAFAAFGQIPELFAALADERPDTLKQVVDLLERLGAKDTTERERGA